MKNDRDKTKEQLIIELEEMRQQMAERLETAANEALQFKKALDQVSSYVYIKDTKSRYRYANELTLKLFGCSAKELGGCADSNFFPPDVAKRLRKIDLRVLHGEQTSEEIVSVRDSGEQQIFLEVKTPLRSKNREEIIGLLGISTDITERKQVEEKLNLQASLLEQIDSAIITIDFNNIILSWNKRAEVMYQWTNEEAVGKNITELLAPDELKEQTLVNFEQLNRDGHWEGDYEVLRKDGSKIPVHIVNTYLTDLSGKNIGFIGMSNDITERKLSEKKIIEYSKNLKMAQRIAEIGNWRWNPKTNTLIWSEQTYRHLGFEPGEVNPTFELYENMLHPDDRDKVNETIQLSLETGEPYSLEMRMFPKGGGEKTFLSAVEIMHDDKSEADIFYGTMLDITESRQAESELLKQQHFLEKAQEMGHIGTWILDITNNILEWTDENYKIFGVTVGTELDYERFINIVHPEDRATIDSAWRDALEHVPYNVEHRLLVNGKTKWVRQEAKVRFDESGKAISAIGFTQDITERKQSDNIIKEYSENLEHMIEKRTKEVKKATEEFERIFKLSSDMICIADLKTVNFLKVNPAFTSVLGYNEQELLSSSIMDFVHPDDKETTSERARYQLNNKKSILDFNNRYICKDGSVKYLEWTGSPVYDKGITYAIARDATERKEAEKELAEANDKVAQAQRLTEIGQLATGIAHELRNPLAIINNAAYYLKMKLANSDENITKSLNHLETQVFRSSNIIEGLLDFANTKQPNLSNVDLQSVVEETINSISIPKSVAVNIDMAKDLPVLEVDREQMLRVFSNLINNSIQAIHDSGKLSISSKKVGNYIVTDVTDTGRGISPHNIEKIFDAMFTTKSSMGGIGIGLAITKTLVEANKGTITVRSTEGKGTIFTVKLPIVQ